MEGQHTLSREKSRPPYNRTASRSSTASNRVISQSANSSTSHTSTSPQLHNAHPAHRFHHASCSQPTLSPKQSARPTPQLSREGSVESTRQTPVSSFLQEKLQKERRAESQKHGSSVASGANSDASASVDLGSVAQQQSPVRNNHLDVDRPQSTAGADASQKKGLALKEMEQVSITALQQACPTNTASGRIGTSQTEL